MKERPAILVIEDEPAVAETIAYALQTEGFEPLGAATGEAGLALVQQRKVALVVLDVGLPDVNGFELCGRLRRLADVPVIFLTARADEVDRVVGLELGADDYMVKPFSPRELSARVKAVLRRAAAAPALAAPRAPARTPLEVDAVRCRITYFGRPLDLTRREYRILEVFARQPGRVFSREALMDLAWEEPEASLERTVDAHVKTLRAKLRAVRRAPDAILTHRGLGYSLRDDW